MLRELRTAIAVLAVLTIVTGVLYPLLVWSIGRAAFPDRASGSFVVADGKVRGSRLVGQAFDDPRWFWGRPSATSPACNGAASGGSNLGPTNPALLDAIRERVATVRASPGGEGRIPIDLVTASGSGLDPHVSPAAAYFQVPRVATARNVAIGRVRELVARHVEPPTLGFLGGARVNVLGLNLDLERLR
jgi:K+-transporting ATPase ATPase C chain